MSGRHDHSRYQTGNLKTAFFLNLFFTIFEIAGGLLTNSIAIISDALHDLGDSLSLGLSWYFQKLSHKKRDRRFTFGYGRFSVFGAIINSFVLVIGSVLIIIEAIPRIISPVQPETQGMMLLAVLGIIVNGAAVFRLKKGTSLNEKVAGLHLLEDVLGWIAVLIASIVMTFWDVPILDALLSLIIAAYILFNVYKNLNVALKIVLQGIPPNINLKEIESKINAIEGISELHDTHLWTMDGEYNVLTTHIVLKENKDLDYLSSLKKTIRITLKSEQIEHITIEFETLDEKCVHQDC